MSENKPPNPLADLDMTKPFEATKEEVEEIVRKIKADMAKHNQKCRNGRGCPMCWDR